MPDICSNCGEANDPTRKFCRRCGTTLVAAQVVAPTRLPWYRRLFHREPKQPKPMQAGDRVGSMQAGAKAGMRRFMNLRSIIVGALAIFVAIVPSALGDGLGLFLSYVLFVFAFATVGAIVASRRPRNAIGWLLLLAGLSYVIGALCWLRIDVAEPLGDPVTE